MKLAIIITTYADNTLGLVRALCERGHDVDMYYLKMDTPTRVETTAYEFEVPGHNPGCVYELDYSTVRGANFIRQYKNSHLYYAQSFRELVKMPNPIPTIMLYVNRIFIKKLSKFVDDQGYDMVDIISPLKSTYLFDYYLKRTPYIHSFHEIFVNHMGDRRLVPELAKQIERNKIIRVFSQNCKEEILSLYPNASDLIEVVPFGIFHNYKDFGNITIPDVEAKRPYILHFGFLVPYKGIDYLYDAIKILENRGVDVSVVIAGMGDLSILAKIKEDPHFLLIQKFLSNDEIAYLVSKSTFVVCPYLSASQSGMPQTSYIFNKPLVATRVGSFPSMVIDGVNGLLVPPSDSEKLADAIQRLYLDKNLLDQFSRRLSVVENDLPETSWSRICENYIKLVTRIKMTYYEKS